MAIFTGTAGNDTIGPTAFNGVAANFTAADTLNGNNGDDTLNGAAGADIVNGGAGIDTIFAGLGDSVDGGTENDVVRLSGLPTRILGGAGTNDILRIDAAGLNLSGLTAANFGGFERLLTPGFTPTLTAAQVNAFTVLGAAGFGAVSFNLAGAVAPIDLTGNLDPTVTSLVITGSAGAENITVPATYTGTVTFTGFSAATGSGADVFTRGGNDTISGGAGNDQIGRNGDASDGAADVVNGGAGQDNLFFGTGDRVDAGTENDVVAVVTTAPAVLAAGAGTGDLPRIQPGGNGIATSRITGFEILETNSASVTLTEAPLNAFTTIGTPFLNQFIGVLTGAAATVDLTSNIAPNIVDFALTGSSGNDVITAPATLLGGVVLRGGPGVSDSDRLTDGAGADTLVDGNGADVLNGGEADWFADLVDRTDNAADPMNGGAGDDNLHGGRSDILDGAPEPTSSCSAGRRRASPAARTRASTA